jgi:hypothetical protein
MKRKSLLLLAATVLVAMAFTACSETDNSANEFPNWQATNETYFDSIYNVAKANSAQWKVIPNITLPSAAVKKSTDNVAIQVIETGAGSEYAMQNDTVRVILQGRLKPSPGYPQGKVFQQTYVGTGDKTTASVAKMAMVTAVPGLQTALQNMPVGAKWRIYVPYQLGFGSVQGTGTVAPALSTTVSVPAYSTLIYTIELVSILRQGHK